jgi:mRNA interferase RelE/StbE
VAGHSILIKPSAAKELEAVPLKQRRLLVSRLRRLSTNPRPPGCEKLSGTERYRVRQGDYRAVHQVQDHGLQVIIVKIGHRRDVYR